jgi:hypothetical protein
MESSLLETSLLTPSSHPPDNSEQQQEEEEDRKERLRQRAFTLSMGLTSLIGLVALTYETRWISALGATQLQAYSVGHSACFYMSPLSSLWAGVTAKVGRAIGRDDDLEVSKLLKMTLVLVAGTVGLTWFVYAPFARWLLVSVYEADAAILPDALAYLRIKTLGECEQLTRSWPPSDATTCVPACELSSNRCVLLAGSVEYFADAGSCVLQGIQELRLTVALNLFRCVCV